MNQKIWISKFIVITIFIIISISCINYVINPYGVFNHKLDKCVPHKTNIVSDRMSKFYEANHLNPKTILMGTSRSGFFSTSQLEPYAPKPIYNYSMAGSSVDEQAAYLQYMITHHQVKTIIWSLDFFSFNPTKPINSSFDAKRFEHEIYWNDYLFALFSFKTLGRSFKTVKKNLFSKIEEPSLTQTYTEKQIDFNIAYILNQYATEKSFLASEEFKIPDSIVPKLELVQETLLLCKKHNVQCVLYTSPVYYQHLDMIYSIGLGNTFESWKKGLSKISEYTDFCTYNTITIDKMNFTDSSHIVGNFGNLVFGRIFHNTAMKIPKDFGVLVNSISIDQHLKNDRKLRQPFFFDRNAS